MTSRQGEQDVEVCAGKKKNRGRGIYSTNWCGGMLANTCSTSIIPLIAVALFSTRLFPWQNGFFIRVSKRSRLRLEFVPAFNRDLSASCTPRMAGVECTRCWDMRPVGNASVASVQKCFSREEEGAASREKHATAPRDMRVENE